MPGKCCGCTDVLTCSPCDIPKATLTLSFGPSSGSASTSSPLALTYHPAGLFWDTPCWFFFNGVSTTNALSNFIFECSGGVVYLSWYDSPACGGDGLVTCAPGLAVFKNFTLVSSTCSPFHLHFSAANAIPALECLDMLSFGFSDLYVDI